ncbi:hypothetical protein [Ideonella sp. BN130291]|uniref:hypothetical protein n=1 Tax=Ideonella sp. BN130291 TaxID=3112940 RepID=UPI002E2715C2|nr:hypothetical protein [Ideonella sp. BN130291]
MSAATPFCGSPYGADEHGLICGYRLGSPPAQAIGCVEAMDWLAQPGAAGFVWLHFNLSHGGTLPWLQRHGGMPPTFFESLAQVNRSTRRERATAGCLLPNVVAGFSAAAAAAA